MALKEKWPMRYQIYIFYKYINCFFLFPFPETPVLIYVKLKVSQKDTLLNVDRKLLGKPCCLVRSIAVKTMIYANKLVITLRDSGPEFLLPLLNPTVAPCNTILLHNFQCWSWQQLGDGEDWVQVCGSTFWSKEI